MSFLNLNKIDFSYGTHSILNQISLEVEPGQLMSLIGPSGCGKTTLLRIIAGFEKPQKGSIQVKGKTLWDSQTQTPASERNIGFVFQDYALFPHLSVSQNILFGCPKMSADEQSAKVKYLSELLKLEDHLDKYPHQLSGGQQQRVAIARALAPEPQMILFDEPFSNLDAHLKKDLGLEIRSILSELNMTGILVTHDIEDSLSISDQIALMKEGQILQVGSPQELYQKPKSIEVASFISSGIELKLTPTQDGYTHPNLGLLRSPVGPAQSHLLWLKSTDLEIHEEGTLLVIDQVQFQGSHSTLRLRDSAEQFWSLQVPSSQDYQPGDQVKVRFKAGLYLY